MIDSVRKSVFKTPTLGVAAQALALALVIGLGVVSVSAQESSRLKNPLDEEGASYTLPPPVSLIPVPSEGATPRSSGSSLVPEGVIAMRQLDDLSPDSLGLFDGVSGGFPTDMWLDTPKELVDILLPKLPWRVTSPVARELAKRLLLSVARPPEPAPSQDVFVDMTVIVPSAVGFTPTDNTIPINDGPVVEQMAAADEALLERRLAQLAAMGDWESVSSLIELVPQMAVTDRIRILEADLDLVEGRVDQVCANAGERLRVSSEPYWQKVFAFCQLRDGNIASAFLTLDLLRESGGDDVAFFWVAELMAGNRPITPNGLDRLSPLQLAMLRTAKRPFPAQLVRDGDPTLLKVLATADPLYVVEADAGEEVVADRLRRALDLRLDAAERAVGLGALDPDVLRALYRAEVDADANAAAESIGPSGTNGAGSDSSEQESILDLGSIPVATPMDRAKLFQLAEMQTIPTARVEVISRAIDFARNDRGRTGPDVSTMGFIFTPLLKEIEPTGDLVWFAGNAARALIASGEVSIGVEWLELTQLYARTSIEASDVAAAMWPTELQLRPSVSNRFTPLRLKRWEESRPSGRLAADKALVLSTFMALHEPVETLDWMSLMDRRARASVDLPTPQVWNALTLASQAGRLGETVLLSLIALDEAGTAASSPIVLSHVISSLFLVGLEDEARRFAVEAAVIQGL